MDVTYALQLELPITPTRTEYYVNLTARNTDWSWTLPIQSKYTVVADTPPRYAVILCTIHATDVH